LVLPEHILTVFNVFFYVLIIKKHVLTVSHMTVTLQIMSNSRRSSLMINAQLPTDQAGGNYCSDRRKFKKMAAIIRKVTSLLSSSSRE
jgi:hypothetical protein